MNSLDGYIMLNKKVSSYIKCFIFVSLLILITLIIFSQIKYKKYYNTIGQVVKEDNSYQILVYVPLDKLEIIKNNNTLIIDNKDYNYQIKHIYSEYMISDNLENVLKMILSLNLESKDMIENNILNIKFEKSEKKIIYYLKEYLLEGSV